MPDGATNRSGLEVERSNALDEDSSSSRRWLRRTLVTLCWVSALLVLSGMGDDAGLVHLTGYCIRQINGHLHSYPRSKLKRMFTKLVTPAPAISHIQRA